MQSQYSPAHSLVRELSERAILSNELSGVRASLVNYATSVCAFLEPEAMVKWLPPRRFLSLTIKALSRWSNGFFRLNTILVRIAVLSVFPGRRIRDLLIASADRSLLVEVSRKQSESIDERYS